MGDDAALPADATDDEEKASPGVASTISHHVKEISDPLLVPSEELSEANFMESTMNNFQVMFSSANQKTEDFFQQ